MIPNPRMRRELAEFLKCPVEHVMGFTPDPKLYRHSCEECRRWKRGVCDLNGDVMECPGCAHSCGKFVLRVEPKGRL